MYYLVKKKKPKYFSFETVMFYKYFKETLPPMEIDKN